jgi:uncharacterized membrane protein (DUF4010 family)
VEGTGIGLVISQNIIEAMGGSSGLYAVALVSGLTDVDAIILSSLRLYELGKLEATETVTAISLGILSNIGFKLGLIFFIGNSLLAKQCISGMFATAGGIGLRCCFFRFDQREFLSSHPKPLEYP